MGKKQNTDNDQIQHEIRVQQKFSTAGAIGRAGSGLLKGESPVSLQDQAINALTRWIDQQTPDPSGALKSILRRKIRGNELLVANHLQHPLNVLRELINSILASDYALEEFVRQVDVRWGELYQERPLFQQAGQAAKPADEYTHKSVRQDLTLLRKKLQESV